MLGRIISLLLILQVSQGFNIFSVLEPVASKVGLGNAARTLGQISEKAQSVLQAGAQLCPPMVSYCKAVQGASMAIQTINQVTGQGGSSQPSQPEGGTNVQSQSQSSTIQSLNEVQLHSNCGKTLGMTIPFTSEEGKEQFMNLKMALNVAQQNVTDKIQESTNSVKKLITQKMDTIQSGITQTQNLVNQNINLTNQVLSKVDAMGIQLNNIQDQLLGVTDKVDHMQDYLVEINDNINTKMGSISQSIQKLQQSIGKDIEQVLDAIEQANCYQTIAKHEGLILTQMSNLQKFSDAQTQGQADYYRTEFQKGCETCQQSVEELIRIMGAGPETVFQCKVLGFFYNGSNKNKFVKGHRQQILDKSSYMLNLIYQGITVTTAYHTMWDQPEANEIITQQYQEDINKVINNIYDIADQCSVEMWQNIEEYVQSEIILKSTPDTSNEQMSNNIFDYLNATYPWYDWTVITFESPTSYLYDTTSWVLMNQVVLTTSDNITIIITGFENQINSTQEILTNSTFTTGLLADYINYLWMKDTTNVGVFLIEQAQIYKTFVISDTFGSYIATGQLLIMWKASNLKHMNKGQLPLPSNQTTQVQCNASEPVMPQCNTNEQTNNELRGIEQYMKDNPTINLKNRQHGLYLELPQDFNSPLLLGTATGFTGPNPPNMVILDTGGNSYALGTNWAGHVYATAAGENQSLKQSATHDDDSAKWYFLLQTDGSFCIMNKKYFNFIRANIDKIDTQTFCGEWERWFIEIVK